MSIYLFTVVAIIVLAGIIQNKKKYCIIAGFIIFLVLALRNDMLGSDGPHYYRAFNIYSRYTLLQVLRSITLFTYSEVAGGKEGFFVLLLTLFAKIGAPYHAYIVVQSAFCAFSATRFIYKYSKNPCIGFIFLICFGFFGAVICLQRMALAFSVLLYTIPYIKAKKLWKFILLVITASLFHSSAVIFLVVYPVSRISVNKKNMTIFMITSLSLFVVVPFLFNYLITPLIRFMYRSYRITRFSWNNIFLFMLVLGVFVIGFEHRKDNEFDDDNEYDNVLLWCFLTCVPAQIFAFYSSIFSRISIHYFMPISAGIIPNIIENVYIKKNKKLLSIMIPILLIMYFYIILSADSYGITPYVSVWG